MSRAANRSTCDAFGLFPGAMIGDSVRADQSAGRHSGGRASSTAAGAEASPVAVGFAGSNAGAATGSTAPSTVGAGAFAREAGSPAHPATTSTKLANETAARARRTNPSVMELARESSRFFATWEISRSF
jgi:hypothetical protein